jgi:hypothetical protein
VEGMGIGQSGSGGGFPLVSLIRFSHFCLEHSESSHSQ